MKDNQFVALGKLAAGVAIGAAAVTLIYQASAHAQPITPPPGVNWVAPSLGRSGGVVTGNQPYLQYVYPSYADVPYKLNPGAGWTLGGIAVGAVGTAAGQPLAAGVAAGAMGAIGAQADKTQPRADLAPTIRLVTPPPTPAAGWNPNLNITGSGASSIPQGSPMPDKPVMTNNSKR